MEDLDRRAQPARARTRSILGRSIRWASLSAMSRCCGSLPASIATPRPLTNCAGLDLVVSLHLLAQLKPEAPCSGHCRDHAARATDRRHGGCASHAGDSSASMTVCWARCDLRADELGDPVVFRRDGVPAYQLAVVVDDAARASPTSCAAQTCWTARPGRLRICAALGLPRRRYAPSAAGGGARRQQAVQVPPVACRSEPAGHPAAALLRTLRLLGYAAAGGLGRHIGRRASSTGPWPLGPQRTGWSGRLRRQPETACLFQWSAQL